MSEPIRQQASPAEVETREWLDSLEYVLAASGPERVIELLDRLQDRARRRGVSLPFATEHALRQHHPPRTAAPLSGRPPPGAAAARHPALERRHHGGAGQPGRPDDRRPHRHLRLGGDPDGGRLPPLPAGADGRLRGRPRVLPGPHLARHLRPRLPGGPPERGPAAQLPPRAAARRRPALLPPPAAHAGVLALPLGLHGPGADHGHLPGPLQPLPRGPRPQGARRRQGLGLPRRRRDGRARGPGGDLPGLPRAARQPRLRHQLQPAAPRRPGARQRQDHPGAGDRLPRRRVERHQGDLGLRLGPAAGPRPGGAHSAPHGRAGGRPVPEVLRLHGRVPAAALLRRRRAPDEAVAGADRRADPHHPAGRPRPRRRSTPPSAPPSSSAAPRRWCWPRRSRASAWAASARGR